MLRSVPVVAHGLKDSIVKLNWPWNEQGRVRRLARHFLGCFLFYLGDCFIGRWYFGCLDNVSLIVFEVCTPLSGEGGVQFEKRSGVEVPREELETSRGA